MFFSGKNFQALLNLYRKTNCSHIDLLVLRNVIQYQTHVNIFGDTPLITNTLILTAVDTSQTSINAATNKEKVKCMRKIQAGARAEGGILCSRFLQALASLRSVKAKAKHA